MACPRCDLEMLSTPDLMADAGTAAGTRRGAGLITRGKAVLLSRRFAGMFALIIGVGATTPGSSQQAMTAEPRGRSACVTRLGAYVGPGEDIKVCLRSGAGGNCRVWGCQTCDSRGSGR